MKRSEDLLFEKFAKTLSEGSSGEFAQVYEEMFDKTLTVQGVDKEMSYDEWLDATIRLREKGAKMALTIENSKDTANGVYEMNYSVELSFPDGSKINPKSKAYWRDGKYFKHESVTPEAYDKMKNI